jgi:aspartate racemase
MLVSCPSIIPDRTEFLLGGAEIENPAFGIFESARKLHAAGVKYAVIACNTAHAGRIFGPFCAMARESLSGLEIINMLETCALYVRENFRVRRIGLLATRGTHQSGVYREYFGDGFELIEPDEEGQKRIHEAIYSEEFGIKAFSAPIKPLTRDTISREISGLVDRGAQAVILGCTELPLAVEKRGFPVPVIDPALIAARALISLAAVEKLLP